MSQLLYPWTIFVGVLEVCVAYLCFERFSDPYQVVLLALLGAIYLKAKSLVTGTREVAGFWHIQTEFVKIRKLLNDTRVNEEEAQQAEPLAKATVIQGYIGMVFSGIIWLIILFHLFRILV